MDAFLFAGRLYANVRLNRSLFIVIWTTVIVGLTTVNYVRFEINKEDLKTLVLMVEMTVDQLFIDSQMMFPRIVSGSKYRRVITADGHQSIKVRDGKIKQSWSCLIQ